jgi:heat shock protein HslJ
MLGGCASSGGGADGDDTSPEPTESAATLTTEILTGTWGSEDEQKPNLVFADDGAVSGSDGCNRLVGSWTLEGDAVTFSQLATTLMACEGVDTWLSGATSAKLVAGEDDELQIFDADDKEIGTLERAD